MRVKRLNKPEKPRKTREEPSYALMKILANNIIQYRIEHNYSQEEFAKSCKLHRTYISAIERCKRNVTLGTLEKLAAHLFISVPELLTDYHKRMADKAIENERIKKMFIDRSED
jgi:transcriptional regulator with XRE-family HTH domain